MQMFFNHKGHKGFHKEHNEAFAPFAVLLFAGFAVKKSPAENRTYKSATQEAMQYNNPSRAHKKQTEAVEKC